MTKEEKARFDAAVLEEVTKIMTTVATEQQRQSAKAMELAIKTALKGVDKANVALQKAQKAVIKELDAVQKARAKAEKEGEKMANEYFAGKQIEFKEAVRTELLRQLTRQHLEAGKKPRDIAQWLDIPKDFVDNINELLGRVAKYYPPKPERLQLEGNPTLRYEGEGRGGTIWFESLDTKFSMWWEFAGGDALVIVAIPTAAQWEAETKLPLAKRMDTLTFMGEQILADKVSSGGSFIIGENVMTFYAAANLTNCQ